MRNNRSIVKFQPVGTVYGTWYMEFHNTDDLETHTVAMEEHNGLWYASNSILKPPTSGGPTKKILSHSAHRELTNWPQQFYTMENHSEAPTISIRTAGVFTNRSKALKQLLELWRQQTGHLSPQTMYHTQKYVNGMPPLTDASPIF